MIHTTEPPIFTGHPSDHAQGTAERFAREHWPEPREIEYLTGGKFRMVDGSKIYEVRIAPGQRYGVYQVDDDGSKGAG